MKSNIKFKGTRRLKLESLYKKGNKLPKYI